MPDNNEAQDLLDSRVSVYGERVKNMENVAKVFSGILGIEVRPDQVTLLMMGYKLVRASGTPDYEDNIKDVEGYALMFREIIGDDMIPAVNTDEYVAEKWRKENDPCYWSGHTQDPAAEQPVCGRCGEPLFGNPETATRADRRRHEQIVEMEEQLEQLRSWDKPRTMADVEELLTIADVQQTFGPYEETSEDFEERRQEEQALSNSMGREDNVKPPLGAKTQALTERIRLRFDKERAFLMGHARAAEIAAMEAMAQRGDE